MLYAFIIFYLAILPITFIVFFWKILAAIDKLKEQPTKEEKTEPVRKHFSVGKSDFDNAFGGRKAYSIYKNNNGLYEPVTPSRGIEIKKKEE